MDDSRLLIVALLASTIGLFILIFVSAAQGPMPISEIAPENIGSKVVVEGSVSETFTTPDGHLFFQLADSTKSIKIVAFSDVAEGLACVEDGVQTQVRGMVDEYRSGLEIIVSKAADVKCLK